MKVHVPREIKRKVDTVESLKRNLKQFIACCEEGSEPPRIFKQSGRAANGDVFAPFVALSLHHHHLHRDGDPLLILQKVGDDLYAVALSSHAIYFGDKMAWLKLHHEAIDWNGCEDLRQEVLAYVTQSNN